MAHYSVVSLLFFCIVFDICIERDFSTRADGWSSEDSGGVMVLFARISTANIYGRHMRSQEEISVFRC